MHSVKQRLQTASHSVFIVLKKETALPRIEQKDCSSGVLGDDCGASANLLD